MWEFITELLSKWTPFIIFWGWISLIVWIGRKIKKSLNEENTNLMKKVLTVYGK